MKPMAINTEFTFSIPRQHINGITDTFVGGLFEEIDIKFGKLGNGLLSNCFVKYTLKSTIQRRNVLMIEIKFIESYQKKNKALFFNRIAAVKEYVENVKIKTTVSFVESINVA